MDDPDAVGDFLGDAELVSGKKERHPRAAAIAELLLHDPRVHRVEPHHRLVDDENLRIVQQRARDDEPLLGAVRKILRELEPVVVEMKSLEQLAGAPLDRRAIHAENIADKLHEFRRRQLVVEEGEIRHVGEQCLRLRRLAVHVEAPNPHLAGARPEQPGEHPDRRRFPRRVRPEKGEEFAGRHLEIDLIHGDEVAEVFAKSAGGNHGGFRWGVRVLKRTKCAPHFTARDHPARPNIRRTSAPAESARAGSCAPR